MAIPRVAAAVDANGEPAPLRVSVPHSGLRRPHRKQFVDLQNDIAVSDVALAARENYRSVEHLKRYTTTGMGTDQGKTSNVNALALLGEFTGKLPAAVGTTKFRPPYSPQSLGAIAANQTGELYRPLRRMPGHAWHVAQGATLEDYGGWLRPAAYPQTAESLEAAAQREAANVRLAGGIFEGSPLGKIEVRGPDAARFLDFMYVGTMSTLKVGCVRYGLLLNENGIIVDDGVVARLAQDRFWVNSTSGGAERTAAGFEEWLQCEFVNHRVHVLPVTQKWANVTLSGPRARDLLARIGTDIDLSVEEFPHMTQRDGTLAGVPARMIRASYSGEISFEINVPARYGAALIETAGKLGVELGIK
ncbi:MAG: hypothetical protein ACRD3R_14805, partial [Terriglobales bacterium]